MKMNLVMLVCALILLQTNAMKIILKVSQSSVEAVGYIPSKEAEDTFSLNQFHHSKEDLLKSMNHVSPNINETDSIIYQVDNQLWNHVPNPLYLFRDSYDENSSLDAPKHIGSMEQLKENYIEVTVPTKLHLNKNSPKVQFYFRKNKISVDLNTLEKEKEIENEKQEIITVHQSGAPASSYCLVYLSSGYTSADRTLFINDMRRHLAYYRLQNFWKERVAPKLNIYGIFVPSTVQQYGCRQNPRWWCEDSRTITSVASRAPKVDMRYVLIKHSSFDGAATFGGHVSATNPESGANWQGKLAVHELGHMFFRLHDEYDYGSTTTNRPSTPNCHDSNQNVPWASLIGRNGINIFPVCGFKNWFRPSSNCLMNNMYIIDVFDAWCLMLKQRRLNLFLSNNQDDRIIKMVSNLQ